MNYNFSLLALCIYFLWLFVGRSECSVGSLCEDGKFFDQSKQQFISCHECNSEIQTCSLCCNQVESDNVTTERSSNHHLQPLDTLGPDNKIMSSGNRDVSPNILVASIVGFFMLISLLTVILVILKRYAGRREEGTDLASGCGECLRRPETLTVMTMENISESADTARPGDS